MTLVPGLEGQNISDLPEERVLRAVGGWALMPEDLRSDSDESYGKPLSDLEILPGSNDDGAVGCAIRYSRIMDGAPVRIITGLSCYTVTAEDTVDGVLYSP